MIEAAGAFPADPIQSRRSLERAGSRHGSYRHRSRTGARSPRRSQVTGSSRQGEPCRRPILQVISTNFGAAIGRSISVATCLVHLVDASEGSNETPNPRTTISAGGAGIDLRGDALGRRACGQDHRARIMIRVGVRNSFEPAFRLFQVEYLT